MARKNKNIDFTAEGSGYYRVLVDGVVVSNHTTEREALQNATDYELTDPTQEVYVDHDYRVRVDKVGGTTPDPDPTPDPEPDPEPEPEPDPDPTPDPTPDPGDDSAVITGMSGSDVTVVATWGAVTDAMHVIVRPTPRVSFANVTSPHTFTLPRGTSDAVAGVSVELWDNGTYVDTVLLGTITVPALDGSPSPDPTPVPPPGPTPVPPPPSSGWSPPATAYVDEDFTAYTDMQDFEARSPYGWGHGNLQGWGPNNVNIDSRGLMYRFRADNSNPCRDQHVGEAQVYLPDGVKRLWLEFDVEWGPNYKNVRNDLICPPAGSAGSGSYGYKFVLAWLNAATSEGERRYNWIVDGDNMYEFAVPGFATADDVPVNPGGTKVPGDATTKTYPPETVRSGLAGGPKPGQTQHYRLYMGEESPGVYKVYAEVDGVVTHDYTTNSVNDGLFIKRVMLGSNRNSWPEQDVFMWWKNMKIWV